MERPLAGGVVSSESVDGRPIRLEWNGVPQEVACGIKPFLYHALFCLPQWVAEVNIFWSDSNDTANGDASLSVTVRDEYRFLSVYVHPSFLGYDAASKYRMVLHEFSHATLRPLDALLETMVDQNRDEDGRTILRQMRRKLMEGACQDMTEALYRAKPWTEDAAT